MQSTPLPRTSDASAFAAAEPQSSSVWPVTVAHRSARRRRDPFQHDDVLADAAGCPPSSTANSDRRAAETWPLAGVAGGRIRRPDEKPAGHASAALPLRPTAATSTPGGGNATAGAEPDVRNGKSAACGSTTRPYPDSFWRRHNAANGPTTDLPNRDVTGQVQYAGWRRNFSNAADDPRTNLSGPRRHEPRHHAGGIGVPPAGTTKFLQQMRRHRAVIQHAQPLLQDAQAADETVRRLAVDTAWRTSPPHTAPVWPAAAPRAGRGISSPPSAFPPTPAFSSGAAAPWRRTRPATAAPPAEAVRHAEAAANHASSMPSLRNSATGQIGGQRPAGIAAAVATPRRPVAPAAGRRHCLPDRRHRFIGEHIPVAARAQLPAQCSSDGR